MPILTSIINWLNVKRIHQMDLFRKYPAEVQLDTFHKLITKAADTEWGKKHSFKSVSTIKDYQRCTPIQNYEEVKPYVDRLRQGENDLLWPGEIRWFAKSSGTTCDKSKFIPVSKESLEECHFRGGKDVLAIFCYNNPEPKSLKGRDLPWEAATELIIIIVNLITVIYLPF